jgi:predicted ArsR family transcriptional regulator
LADVGDFSPSLIRDFIVNFVTDNSKLSPREVILEEIKRTNGATVEKLAVAADVSPVTVRHHLNTLQAEGLLETSSVRRKVGRPYYVYSLSTKGHELFPKRYVRLSSRLLDELRDRFPDGTIGTLFHNVVERITDEHRSEFENKSFEKRLDYLVILLAEEGFLASWELTENGYKLIEYSCPYISVGQKHHEVCVFDKQLIQIVMDTEINQHSCMIDGDSCCEFTFPVPAGKEVIG